MSAWEWPAIGNIEEGDARESALLHAALAGNRAAAERLLAPYERSLFQLCRGMLGHAEDAEDAVQETFLRALRALDRFRGEAALRTWLYRIAVNVCREWRRSRPVADPDTRIDSRATLVAPSAEEVVVRQLRIVEALQTLPPRHRALLLLREVEGWSIGEIAGALSCSKKRVENDLYRARCALAAWRRKDAAEHSTETNRGGAE